jgi:hypothetical protein
VTCFPPSFLLPTPSSRTGTNLLKIMMQWINLTGKWRANRAKKQFMSQLCWMQNSESDQLKRVRKFANVPEVIGCSELVSAQVRTSIGQPGVACRPDGESGHRRRRRRKPRQWTYIPAKLSHWFGSDHALWLGPTIPSIWVTLVLLASWAPRGNWEESYSSIMWGDGDPRDVCVELLRHNRHFMNELFL